MHEERSENGSWYEDLFIRHRERQNGRRTTKNIIDERRSAFFCYYMAEDLGDPAEHMHSESNRHMIRSLGEFHRRQKTKRHLRGVYELLEARHD